MAFEFWSVRGSPVGGLEVSIPKNLYINPESLRSDICHLLTQRARLPRLPTHPVAYARQILQLPEPMTRIRLILDNSKGFGATRAPEGFNGGTTYF